MKKNRAFWLSNKFTSILNYFQKFGKEFMSKTV